MASNTITDGKSAQAPDRTQQIPVRTITSDDLRFALRQGLDDFLAMRGDILIAGLVYTLVGLAAVVMTANRPLIPRLMKEVQALFG